MGRSKIPGMVDSNIPDTASRKTRRRRRRKRRTQAIAKRYALHTNAKRYCIIRYWSWCWRSKKKKVIQRSNKCIGMKIFYFMKIQRIIKSKFVWKPNKNHHTIQRLTVNSNVDKKLSEKKKLPINNISSSGKKAIECFSKWGDLIVIKADKGMVTVILDLEDYIVKANNQLENNLLYQRLNEDPVTKHPKMVNTATKNLRSKNDRRNPNTSVPYLTINLRAWYLSEASSKLSGMSRKQNFKVYWLILQPHANVLHSYIKDTLTDFINEISETENIPDTIHVTLDVTSLCTNILNPEGIESTKEALNCVNQKPIERKIIIRFLLLILTLNNLIFNGFYYLSNMGCTMSTICVPGYSIVFMVKFQIRLQIFWKKHMLFRQNDIAK